MSAVGYVVHNTAAVSLSAATAKSVLGFRAGTQFATRLRRVRLGFNSTTSSNVPAVVDLCVADYATNPPGTASTSVTVQNLYGAELASTGMTAAENWTTEPTTLDIIDQLFVPVYHGTAAWDYSVGESPESWLSEGFVLRVTSPSAVSVRATLIFERI